MTLPTRTASFVRRRQRPTTPDQLMHYFPSFTRKQVASALRTALAQGLLERVAPATYIAKDLEPTKEQK